MLNHSQSGGDDDDDAHEDDDDGARPQRSGLQESYSKTSLESIFFPSFFQVIYTDICPGHTKSVNFELNS